MTLNVAKKLKKLFKKLKNEKNIKKCIKKFDTFTLNLLHDVNLHNGRAKFFALFNKYFFPLINFFIKCRNYLVLLL